MAAVSGLPLRDFQRLDMLAVVLVGHVHKDIRGDGGEVVADSLLAYLPAIVADEARYKFRVSHTSLISPSIS